MRSLFRVKLTALVAVLAAPLLLAEDDSKTNELAAQLRQLDGKVITDADKAKQLGQMLSQDVRARRDAANLRESKAWNEIKTKADWEKYRDVRIKALRESLGQFPPAPKDLKVRVTGTLKGEGYRIENVVFESRPGLFVTANLYLPAESPKSMPGILICHSHHNPKTQSELQDMGILWARLGCLVLVMDQLGHGERRQHPFVNEKSYPGTFRPSRQDYYFRYNEAMQLHLIGDSLIGWMAWNLMRGVDLLLQKGADKEKIILMGAVAGGGDPAAVTAAIDPRIAAAVPFNFGGPQPETTYPLPADAEDKFNYAGGGSWESTRNLRLSARDGFLPWVIVGSLAPRGLIYAHEFAWDKERDPVWKRLEKIYGFYEAADRLAEAHGRGSVKGSGPENTHCNNIGAEHRKLMYPTLKRWFAIAEPEKENQQRYTANELLCLTPEALKEIKLKPLHVLATELGAERAEAARARLAKLKPEERRKQLREDWTRLLGQVDVKEDAKVSFLQDEQIGPVTMKRYVLEVEKGIVIPMVLLVPKRQGEEKLPVVVGIAQGGKQGFLKERSAILARLLEQRVAVCLPDLRGTGETQPVGDSRGRTSASTSLSATELMLGQTLVGSRLRDLRHVLQALRKMEGLNHARIALWGDSFAPMNPDNGKVEVPWDAEKLPVQSEPLGALLALLGALFEDDIHAVYTQGGLAGFQAILNSPFCYVPHDVIVPGALTAGDLSNVAAALVPRALRMEGQIDGVNRRVLADPLQKFYAPATAAYRDAKAASRMYMNTRASGSEEVANWFLHYLRDP